jgi:hypothetical protein
MSDPRLSTYYSKLEVITGKWWFLIILFSLFTLPPYSSIQYPVMEWPLVNMIIITNPIKPLFADYFWMFKVLPLLLIVLLLLFKNKIRRLISIYAALSYVLFGLVQSISKSEQVGIGICTANLILFLLIAFFWLLEAIHPRNDFDQPVKSLWQYWIFIPAFLAFWEPVNPITLMPDFSLFLLFTNGAGLAFCMMTPVYLSTLIFIYPKVNLPLLRVTSLFGFGIGVGNIILAITRFSSYWWIGLLHLPLLILSIYGLAISYKHFIQALKIPNNASET